MRKNKEAQDKRIAAIRELEEVEEELKGVAGMEKFRERISEIRSSLVQAELEEEF